MYGFIDGFDFGEMEIQKYYCPPSTWSDEKKRENARMKIYSGDWYGSEKRDGYFAQLIKDEDGNIIKSPDTLSKVYAIDKKKNIAVATGKTTGNIGVSYAEGTLCFNMIKTIVMPQYPEYFSGVEK